MIKILWPVKHFLILHYLSWSKNVLGKIKPRKYKAGYDALTYWATLLGNIFVKEKKTENKTVIVYFDRKHATYGGIPYHLNL